MLRSYDIVLNEFRATQPQFEEQFRSGRGWLLAWLRQRALAHGKPGAYADMLFLLAAQDWKFAARSIYWTEMRDAARSMRGFARDARRMALKGQGAVRQAYIGPPGSGALWTQTEPAS